MPMSAVFHGIGSQEVISRVCSNYSHHLPAVDASFYICIQIPTTARVVHISGLDDSESEDCNEQLQGPTIHEIHTDDEEYQEAVGGGRPFSLPATQPDHVQEPEELQHPEVVDDDYDAKKEHPHTSPARVVHVEHHSDTIPDGVEHQQQEGGKAFTLKQQEKTKKGKVKKPEIKERSHHEYIQHQANDGSQDPMWIEDDQGMVHIVD